MSIILGLDTSTDACSVAILNNGVLSEDYRVFPREHTLHLLPMVDALLKDNALTLADVDAIAFAAGPGSFTGLRVCAAMVQGLALGAGLPVLPVSTLRVLAQTALDAELAVSGNDIFCALDARMDEMYWAIYRCQASGELVSVVADTLSAPEKVSLEPLAAKSVIGVGSGLVYRERIPAMDRIHSLDQSLLPRASSLVKLSEQDYQAGCAVAAEHAMPVYLRDEVAWK